MIKLSNGYKFEYMVASGALAFDGKGWPHEKYFLRYFKKWLDLSLFTIVAKTVTYNPRKGNLRLWCPWQCIKKIPDGVVNAVGLTNKGIEWWAEKVGVFADQKKIPLVGSIFSDKIEHLVEMARIMNDFDLVALEINASCPDTGAEFLGNTARIVAGCQEVKKVSRFPLILKVSVVHNINEILSYIKEIIEAISINSVPWKVIFPNKKSPLEYLGGGGVSGKIAQCCTWPLVRDLVAITSIPVIGPSVWNFEDMQRLRNLGAQAISFGSIFLKYPWRPTKFVKRDMKGEK